MTPVATGVLVALVVGVSIGALDLTGGLANADDSSAVTITAKSADADIADAPLPDLAVTLSQTADLTSQGLVISWTGGKTSSQPTTDNGGENFLQVMECWGDDPTIPVGQPAQPDRTTCQYGAFNTPGAQRDNFVTDDEVNANDVQYTAPGGFPVDTYTSVPFRSPAGDTIASVVDNKKIENVNVNSNQYFTAYTSNEVKWAGSDASGDGSVKFEVQTVQQSSGIDCGTPIKATDGSLSGKSCWIVVIPRGTADAGESHITHSGLFYDSWKHRIAFRVGFHPVGINCPIGAAETQIAGSELVAGAVASWQPSLCAASGGSIYTISTKAESDALLAASDPSTPAALALTSRPLDTSGGITDPNSYAPIAVSGISIAFAIDRKPKASASTPDSVVAQTNQSFTSLNLTPRLVAKLLTNSYLDSLPGDKGDVGYNGPKDPGHNARNLTTDPDFLAVNDPEWQYEALTGPALADLLVPQGRSDVAYQLWSYVMADPDAAAFIAGTADPWGMIVNPWNSTSAKINPSGVASVIPTDSFPKADPSELAATTTSVGGAITAGPINLVTWRPYTNDLDTSGYLTLRGDGQVLGPWDTTRQPPAYIKAVRSNPGFQTVLGLTDTAAAAKYQTVSASLLNPAGAFVAPTAGSMSAAAAAMSATPTQAQVYRYDPAGTAAKAAPTAYPLTMPVYAATNPAQNDQATRASYAAFIRYASTTGQIAGTAIGELPEGYAPLPAGWVTQAAAAATAIQAGAAAPVDSTDDSGDGSFGDSSTGSDSGSAQSDLPADSPSGAAPVAAGAITTAVLGGATLADSRSKDLASVIPLSLLAGLLAALAVPILTRIRKRL